MNGSNQRHGIYTTERSAIGISSQLISMWENSNEPWGAKDLESRYLYANAAHFALLNLPLKFDIEGIKDDDIPHPIAEFVFNFQEHDRNVIERQENLASLDIYPYGSEEIIQPYICEKFPLRSEDREKIGIIFQIKKPLFLTPLICCSKKNPLNH